ncbi:hypothetical protein ES708_31278 [subsurface metagenome]
MMFHLVLKEIVDHLKSLRFMIVSLLVIILMTASAILFITDFNEQTSDFDNNNNETLAKLSLDAAKEGGMFYVFSFNFQGP